MITNITIQNMGCFDDSSYSIDLNKFTILIGPNNSGKSTFFKGLNLVRSIPFSGGGIAWNSLFYSLNNYQSTVYAHDVERTMTISTKYTIGSDIYESIFGFKGNNITKNDFIKNNTRISELSSNEHKEVASSVWYVSASRTVIPYTTKVGQNVDPMQPLHPAGNNIGDYLIGRFTDKDGNWAYAEKWLKEIDQNMTFLKTPLTGNAVSMVTSRKDNTNTIDVNVNLQGSGIQNAMTIVAALVFSPKGSTVILEEPETFLHPKAIEVLIDLCNDVIQNFDKQVIFTTHSMEVMHRISSDMQGHSKNSEHYVQTDKDNFKCITISDQLQNKITEKDLTQETSLGALYDELIGSNTV